MNKSKSISIFYVEDEPFLAKIVKETLESKGFNVQLVSDGAKAIKVFDPEIFDICVLDIMLPNKNGFEIAEEIRLKSQNIPILFLTAKDQTADLLKGFRSGGNDYIRKPFSMEELIVRIENLLNLANMTITNLLSDTAINIGSSCVFYPNKFELKLNSKISKLSHRECQIIKLLCDHKNNVTQRREILKKVWGDDSFYNSRNLDVYITKIRGYFKEDQQIKIITLKGVGYQFVVENSYK